MEFVARINKIDYAGMTRQLADIISVKAAELKKEYPPLRLLPENGAAAGKIGLIMKMIPQNIKNRAAAMLVMKYRDEFIKVINEFLVSHKIALVINNLNAKGENDMIDINVKIDEIDYESIAEQFLPAALEKLRGYSGDNMFIKAISKMDHIPDSLAKSILSTLPQEAKDELVIDFIGGYKDGLIRQINSFIENHQLKMSVADVFVS